ncbi:MAG TPA: HAMP domain-containing sensor histidine kinase [Polyangiaceae bacterium]|nr:HAMP domain-containing sensor histidine kinase [Polyangiaceae bacterium]
MESSHVMAALGRLLLERTNDGRFTRCGPCPDWCNALGIDALTPCSPLVIQDVFPFLEIFLPDAERVWDSREPEHANSDFWTEIGADGEEFHLEASALRVDSENLLVITRNEQLFTEKELVLQRARELGFAHRALTREIELKDILVHSIVHDLASPLHGVLGALTLLSELPQSEEAASWTELALRAAKRQESLVADILDVFSAEHGAIVAPPPASAAPDLVQAIRSVVQEAQPVARVNQVRVEAAVGRVPIRVIAEQTRLVRVLANLVENALRHSPPQGHVFVSLEGEEGTVRVTVDDEGPGVPKEVLPFLFELFAGGKAQVSGTGLGLYFCQITLERWGGGIGYERRPEGGSRFWIRLVEAGAIPSH